MTILLFLIILFNFYFIGLMVYRMSSLRMAETVLNNISYLVNKGIISQVQAKVYLNELDDPGNIHAIIAVKRELDEIYKKAKTSGRI